MKKYPQIILIIFMFLALSACLSTKVVSKMSAQLASSPTITLTYPLKATNTTTFTPTATPSPTITPIILNEFSPENIARAIDEGDIKTLNTIWQRQRNNVPLESFLSSYNNFSVRRFYIETNSTNIEYALIAVGEQKYKRTWHYLVFKRNGSTWQFFGDLELDAKYSIEPNYQVIDVDGDNIWLVVNLLANSGTGFILYEHNWYKLNSDKFEIALRYPVGGSEEFGMGSPPAHVKFRGEPIQYGPDPQTGVYSIEVMFYASYLSSFIDHNAEELPEYYPVFSIERKARYLWSEEQQRFILDLKNSNVNEYEIDKLFHYDATEFVQFTYDELLELATMGNKYQKTWLELMLNQVQSSPRKENLIKLLAR